MILDLKTINKFLLDEDYTGYAIEKATGVDRTTVSNLRRGKTDFKRMVVSTLKGVQIYLDENPEIKSKYE